jgi:hypothetical protein
MAKPTEMAKSQFDYAAQTATAAAQFLDKSNATAAERQAGDYNQAAALAHLARGLSELAIGLRATYVLLEEVKSLIERQSRIPGT